MSHYWSERLLREAIEAWPQFDTQHEEVSGADLVDWFYDFRQRAKAAVEQLEDWGIAQLKEGDVRKAMEEQP